MSSDSGKSLVVIYGRAKVNLVIYMEILEDNVLLWVNEEFENNYVFTQDGAISLLFLICPMCHSRILYLGFT